MFHGLFEKPRPTTASLVGRLALPEGWTYTTRTLDDDFELDSGGLAYVINDDFCNAYQRRT